MPTDARSEQLCFLPLCHILERDSSIYFPLAVCSTVNFAESPETVFDNLREVSPHVFTAVPRVWEKIYSRVTILAQEATTPGRIAFGLALRAGMARAGHVIEGRPVPAVTAAAFWLAEIAVFRNLRRLLGLDRLRQGTSGAAPISPALLKWYHAIGVPLLGSIPLDPSLASGGDEGEPVVMNLTIRALDAFEAWNVPFFAAAENGDIPVFLEGVAAKAPGTVLRLALVLESMAWAAGEPGRGTAITEEAVHGAIALFTYFFAHAERVYRQYRADAQDARVTRLLQWLANRNRKVVKPREVVQSGVAGLTKTADARELMVRAAAASGGACVFSVGDAAMTVDIAQLKRVLHPT